MRGQLLLKGPALARSLSRVRVSVVPTCQIGSVRHVTAGCGAGDAVKGGKGIVLGLYEKESGKGPQHFCISNWRAIQLYGELRLLFLHRLLAVALIPFWSQIVGGGVSLEEASNLPGNYINIETHLLD